MGDASKAQSTDIQENFNNVTKGATNFSAAIKKEANQLTFMTSAAIGLGLLGKRMLEVADGLTNAADRIGLPPICFKNYALQLPRIAYPQSS